MFRNQGNQFYVDNNLVEALNSYTESLKTNEKDKYITYRNIAIVHQNETNFNEALSNIKISLKENSNEASSWNLLAEILFKLNRHDEANVALSQANNLKLNNSDTESDNDSDNEIKQEDIKNDDNLSDEKIKNYDLSDKNELFKKFMSNSVLSEKLQNENFQKKVLENKNNPFAIFQDPEMMDMMKEMATTFK
uniref:Uncharacterized protein n=1 Tax=Megaviridae environmental sample TaxID=1737588 RepID=A0A5J6VMB0_9VIRU|nr:MAG: hypothetical protein [Megaviridae environmental sample]